MKNFYQWCEERKISLELILQTNPPEKTKTESQGTKRSCVRSHAYPPLYGRGQYPAGYFTPIAADAAYYMSIGKK